MSQYFDNKQLFGQPTVSQYGSHMVMTNVTKETKNKYINIDTKFCDEYVNNRIDPSGASFNLAKYTVTLPEKINDVKNMMICNAEIPMSFFNISDAIGNNYFYLTLDVSGSRYTSMITLPDGQYTQSSLSTSLNTIFTSTATRAIFQTFYLIHTVTNYSSVFSTNTPGLTFTINFAVDKTSSFDKHNFKSKLGWLLGFRNLQYSVTSTSSKTSESIININTPNYLYLAIDEFSKGNQSSFLTSLPSYLINKNIIAKITMNKQNYPFGSVLPANNFNGYLMTDKRSYTGKIDLQKLSIQLLDENGNPINLNGIDFSFCIQFEHE